MKHGEDDYSLRKWMENIAHVKTKFVKDQIVYFSEAPQHRHMTSLVRRQRKSRVCKSSRRHLNMSMASHSNNTTLTSPKTWASGLIFRRRRQQRNQQTTSMDDTFKVPQTPQRFRRIAKPTRPMPFTATPRQSSVRNQSGTDNDSITSSSSCQSIIEACISDSEVNIET